MPFCSRRFIPLAVLLGAFLLFPLFSAASEAPPVKINEIRIKGNLMVDEATIRALIESSEGSVFAPEQVTEDIRAIYKLGFFDDVQVDAIGLEGGLRLTFAVTEKPIVRSIIFDGNDKVSESDLREDLEMAPRSVYRPEVVAQAIGQLREIYRKKGYYRAEIDSKTEPAGTGEVQLIFVIKEGKKHRIRSISFTGNKAFSDKELSKEMETKKRGVFSFLTGSGHLREAMLQDDRQLLLNHYHNNGYLESRVGNPEISVDKKDRKIEVMFPVTEGVQYRLGSVELDGDTLVPSERVVELISSKTGDIFRRSAFSKDLFTISQLYTEKGHAYAKVDYSSRLNQDERTIDVVIHVKMGKQVRIGRIVISGNLATRDKVIRRNITFKEGDIFNSAELRKSRRRIVNIGFFEAVDIVPDPQSDETIDINIELKEKLTGAFSVGLGYSSEDLLAGQIRLSESNLFGRGQSLQFLAEYGSVKKSYSVTFAEPAVFDSRYSFGLKVYNTSKEYTEYDRESVGGRVSLGRSIGEYYRSYIAVKHETIDISDVDDYASTIILEQQGKRTTNSIQLTLVRDSRDNFFNPSSGNRTAVSGEYAGGILGEDNDFTKLTAETSQFFPLFWDLVLSFKLRYGIVDGFNSKEPPIYERFFLGGLYTVRGFESRTIGPMDESTGDPIGGYKNFIFNTEILIPLERDQGLKLVLFFDAGNAWNKDEDMDFKSLRTGAGLGLRWLSPIGPFRLEWGWNLNPEKDEPNGDWGFAIGTFF